MSSSHHDNAFQERKRKLSVWVKRIIQPNKEQTHFASAAHAKPHSRRHSIEDNRGKSDVSEQLTRGSAFEAPKHVHRMREPTVCSVVWDKSVTKEPLSIGPRLDFDQSNDNASTAPLISHCSSSAKSSVFSDVTSLQSTRATVLSNKTLETNSSTVGIPPASILDRARHTTGNPGAPSIFSLATTHHTSQANSMRQFSI
ncbi:LANO_0G05666g1_1 [Lachancea nothofagi CBS 11611]|uniref:LANO_0G05666g1_1 n=1 Tax=Lachancea nothofagi CBS 11611 TaxID=1266666 RepID=A0A1G4KGK9_9SACH|nr:LANO_0G05666g1_1 [Lachancea nothofagi CBS 11611]